MLSDIFMCVKRKHIVTMLVAALIFAFADAGISHNLAKLAVAIVNGTFDKSFWLLIIFTVVCMANEWVVDTIGFIIEDTLNKEQSKYFMNKLYKLKPEVLKSHNTGYISSLTDSYIEKKLRLINLCLGDIPITIGFLAYSIWMFSRYCWEFGAGLIVLYTSLSWFRVEYTRRVMHERNNRIRKYEADRGRYYIDTVSNINTIQRMGAKGFMLDKMEYYGDRVIKEVRIAVHLDEISFMVFKYACYLYVPVVLLIMVNTKHPVVNNADFLALCTSTGIKCCHYGRAFYRFFRSYESYKTSSDKINEILDASNVRQDTSKEIFEEINIKNCEYSYGDGNIITIPEFSVYKNDIVCIYGESGQGKTTLLNILSKEIETKYVDKRMDCSFVAQDTEMLDMNLYDNLTLGYNISENRIKEMLEAVGLKEWFKSLEKGFDTILGERGVFVSTGQRQRLNLIRGMLLEKDIYILDEPTSNVDDETERMMVDFLKRELQGKTVVIVTHRPAIMEICNKFYRYEHGVLEKDRV